jgi:hypothetical protein
LGLIFRKAAENSGSPEMASQLEALLNNPAGLGMLVFGTLFLMFIMLTALMAVGGALGAKVLEREN